MGYNRFWFDKDQYAITVGYGVMDNPGRYLTLLPPINGADAVYGSPYYPTGPNAQDPRTGATIPQTQFKGWDTLGHFRLDAQAIHYFPFGVRLSPRRPAVLERQWRDNSAGREQCRPAIGAQPLSASFVCNNGTNTGTASFASAVAAAPVMAESGIRTFGRMSPVCDSPSW